MTTPPLAGLVLALAPTTRGFGFVVFDANRELVDWGVKEVRDNKQEDTILKVRVMLHVLQPAVVVLEAPYGEHSRRAARIRDLLDRIGQLAADQGAEVHQYSRREVLQTFDAKSKDDVAAAVATVIPELAPRLPKRRRIWQSEHHSMAIFEAAALAIVYFGSTE
jgi:hypothetical protein